LLAKYEQNLALAFVRVFTHTVLTNAVLTNAVPTNAVPTNAVSARTVSANVMRWRNELLARTQCHPFPVATTLRSSLVLLYAVDAARLEPFCPPGLALERVADDGLIAVATVQAEDLRLRGAPPWLGRSFMLTGYRVVVRFRSPDGTIRRALRIIQSDTDSRLMCLGGNIFTEYNYRRAEIVTSHTGPTYSVRIGGNEGTTLDVTARIDVDDQLPVSSPFTTPRQARRYTGPLPWTVTQSKATGSFVAVRGRRGQWKPRLVTAEVRTCTFFDRPEFAGATPRLAAVFYIDAVPYSWDTGVRLSAEAVAVGGLAAGGLAAGGLAAGGPSTPALSEDDDD
jgi:Uncharacterized conserved protein (COG2071)